MSAPEWTELNIVLDGDGAWPDLATIGYTPGRIVAVALLPNGTARGRASVTLRIETGDGTVILAQTTLRLLSTAMLAFVARVGEEEWP